MLKLSGWIIAGVVLGPILARGAAVAPPAGSALQRAPDVVAIYVQQPPKIDGRLNDRAWKLVRQDKVGVMAHWHAWAGVRVGPPLKEPRVAYVCWDKKNLYVGMRAAVSDIFKLQNMPGNPFMSDCLEVHIKVVGGAYYQWAIDFLGRIAAGDVPHGVKAEDIRGASYVGYDYWSCEVAIPWRVLHVNPKPGLRLGFNVAANRASQDHGICVEATWGKSYGVQNLQTVLELRRAPPGPVGTK